MEEKRISNKNVEDTSSESSSEKEQIASSLISPYIKSHSQTQFETTTLEFTWKIEKFHLLFKILDSLHSPRFPENGQYFIQINIKRTSAKLENAQLFIHSDTTFIGSCTINVESSGTSLASTSISGRIRNITLLANITDFGYPHTDSFIKIHCVVDIISKLTNNTIHMNSPPPSITFSKDVKSIKDSILDELELKNGKSIKFTVGTEQYVVGTEQYVVSKKLLWATNSSYFKNICLTHEKEKEMTSELTTSSELRAFKELLFYIITGSIKYPYYDMLKELLTTAIKYDVLTLKLTCEYYLLRYITLENVPELIKLAFSSNAKFLETHLATFIKFHMKEIVETKKFQDLSQEDLNKIMELMEKSEILETSTIYSLPHPHNKKL